MDKLKARSLAGFEHGETSIPANVIVLADEDVIASLKAAGVVDDHADAVAYAEEQKFKTVKLGEAEISEKLKQRIEEKQAANTPKALTKKQKEAAIAKLTADEKAAFEKAGGDIEAWLAKTDAERAELVSALVQAAKDAEIIAAFTVEEKAAFEKSGKSLADWQELPEADRNALIEAEKPQA